MGKDDCVFNFIISMLPVFLLLVTSQPLSPSPQPHCHEDEAAALLELEESFGVDPDCILYFFRYGYVHRQLGLWKQQGKTKDCCTWDGIECDHRNGHVIGLDLGGGCLSGFIDSNSSLFRLFHLQKLNLAYNNFGDSRLIPPEIGNLSSLTSLNLSNCHLQGQIPSQILGLTNLSLLDLSNNIGLGKPNLDDIARTFTKLEKLDLSGLVLGSPVPNGFANLSSLKSLIFSDSRLNGEFPTAIFRLPNLEVLDLTENSELSVHLPEFHWSGSPVKSLILRGTNFSGEFPTSFGTLGSLVELDLSWCNLRSLTHLFPHLLNLTQLQLTVLKLSGNEFQGPIPSSFANLTQLTYLDLSANQFSGDIPSFLGNLINLETLYLRVNQLTGGIPYSSFGNLINLKKLNMRSNQLTGGIPYSSFANRTKLEKLDLSYNKLTGQLIPSQILNLDHLTALDLSFNKLSGTVQLEVFWRHTSLRTLILSNNNFSVIAKSDVTGANQSSQITLLGLAACRVHEFPELILPNLEKMYVLDLSDNDIQGPIPMWFLNASMDNLEFLNLSHNSLTAFSRDSVSLKWPNLMTLDLSFNSLREPLAVPPEKTSYYDVSNNRIFGEISPLICNRTSITMLHLSSNNISGGIPECIGNLNEQMKVLSLHDNNLSGTIPDQLFHSSCFLSAIDLSNNRLEGPLPRSLSSCDRLGLLNLENNMLNDTFPSWLGSLYELRVLILRSNRFHGIIDGPKIGFEFPRLHIIDLSHNYFKGHLPSKYFQSWSYDNVSQAQFPGGYLGLDFGIYMYSYPIDFYFTATIINKGIKMDYPRILDYFRVIDLSSNSFTGEIPESIASVWGLHLLNISNNNLIGPIPSLFGDLIDLQALDLSWNNLSGGIPTHLMQLTFLAFFDVSHNDLSGPIPQGNQFSTFGSSSYEGNEGLCGDPLSRKCENLEAPPPPSALQDGDSDVSFKIEWKAVVVGYITAFIICALTGHQIITVKQNGSARTFQFGGKRRIRRR